MTVEERLLFGERLRSRRSALGMTQEDVAARAGISLRFFQMIERGERNVSLETITSFSKTLDISIDYLLFGSLSSSLRTPLTDIIEKLSPRQREDALKILQLYSNACSE